MLKKFDEEHLDMSADLRTELAENLAERVKYTRALLNGFQKKLSEISKENQKIAQKLRKDLDKGEVVRIKEYNSLMKDIHSAIKGIRKEVMDIQTDTAEMLDGLSQNRVQAAAEWIKMHTAIAQIRKNGLDAPQKPVVKEIAKKEVVEKIIETPPEIVKEIKAAVVPPIVVPKPEAPPLSLEEKVLNYIKKNPRGVRVAEMEGPLKETRMRLGFVAKKLLNEGKIQKIDLAYFPLK
jgi:flagellar biosynthesis chaperone FliJ